MRKLKLLLYFSTTEVVTIGEIDGKRFTSIHRFIPARVGL